MKFIGAAAGVLLMIPLAGSVADRSGTGTALLESPAAYSHRLDAAARVLQGGRFGEALELFEQIRNDAAGRDALSEARALSGMGASRILSGEYDTAAQNLLDARAKLRAAGARDLAVAADLNLASLYNQIGDTGAAETIFRANLAGAERSGSANLPGILLELAPAEARRNGIDAALPLFRRGIEAAARYSTPRTAILGLDRMAHALSAAGRHADAERVVLEAYALRRSAGLSLAISLLDLASAAGKRGDLPLALGLHDRSIAEFARKPIGQFPWTFYQARASARRLSGDAAGALADLRVAVELIANRRGALPPADSLRIGFEGQVDSAYDQLVELLLRRPDRAAAEEAFEAVEANRAASLSAHLRGNQRWRAALPPTYAGGVRSLAEAERRYIAGASPDALDSMRRLRTGLIEVELAAGSPVPPSGALLPGLRRTLGAGEVYLSFHVTPRAAWRWAVTHNSIDLRPLTGGVDLAPRIAAFRDAVAANQPEVTQRGRELFDLLFAGLGPADRPSWLWSSNSALFDLPVSALVTNDSGPPRWLGESRALTLTPGAAVHLSRPSLRPPLRDWAAIADPVYNAADPRTLPAPPYVLKPPRSVELARLPASAVETRAIAEVWPDAGETAEGPAVTPRRVRELAESGASILHVAAHVLPAGAISLGFGGGWSPRTIPAESIWRWKVRASLVSLSGCASGAGAALPGTGLVGLTRAWLMAGARDVLATRWPVPDDSGPLFVEFYRQVRAGHSPAAALRIAQSAMIRSRSPRAQPGYWAAYFITGI